MNDVKNDEIRLLNSAIQVLQDEGLERVKRLTRPINGIIFSHDEGVVKLGIDKGREVIENILTDMVNLKVGLAWKGTHYCGRKSSYKEGYGKNLSVLGNRHWLEKEEDRPKVLELYIKDFHRFKRSRAWTMAFNDILDDVEKGEVILGCFCHPKQCHCDVIKLYLQHMIVKRRTAMI
jgi:hypothetical protein